MKLTLIALALSVAGFANPIQVTGSGTFVFDTQDSFNYWTVEFAGSDGVNGVEAAYEPGVSIASGPDRGFIGGGPQGESNQGAIIDGELFHQGFFSFSLGGGSGSITGYDAGHNPVITQALAGYLVITSETCSGFSPRDEICSGTFAVTAPEPSTWLLCSLGLGGVYWRRRVG